MFAHDVQTFQLIAADRAERLRASAARRPAPPRRVRRFVGLWLVSLGVRLALEPPAPARAGR